MGYIPENYCWIPLFCVEKGYDLAVYKCFYTILDTPWSLYL